MREPQRQTHAMRAIVARRFGGPEALEVCEVPTPEPGPGQVGIAVSAAGINRFDLQIREGAAGFPIPLPWIGGMEAVGVISALGAGVDGWTLGDRVMRDVTDCCGCCRYCRSGREWRCVKGAFGLESISGGFAEVLVCDARRLIRLPDELTDVEAAAVQMSYGTAWHMLFSRAGLRAGDVVLVSSVASPLGAAALDIAKSAGAFVIGTASSDERLAIAAQRGLDIAINYLTTDVVAEVRRVTNGAGVDVAFEHIGGRAFDAALQSLAMDGRLVSGGWHGGGSVTLDLMDLARGRKQIIGSVNRTLDELHRCLEMAARGRLRPAVAATFPLESIHDAVALVDSRTAFGKVVVTPNPQAGHPRA
jgi:NADPH:quinone reductase-like Zn-dependent oxidoreductase